jgi:aryl-alcohol dehydrogenase-like predicted oxidoreductase
MPHSHPAGGGIRFCLGGNVFGWTADENSSFAVLDRFYEIGGRMIDTADCYSNGTSEKIIGAWMQTRGVRKDILVGTKMGIAGAPGTLEPANVAAALDAALERLKTDYVDIFYAHNDEPQTPQDEVAAGFDALIHAGKAREIGASNFSTARFISALESADRTGITPYTVLQPGFNLVSRENYPRQLQNICVKRGIAVFPYFGLASGYLTGKYRTEDDFAKAGSRGEWARNYAQNSGTVLAVLDQLTAETKRTHAQISLAWLSAQPGIAAPLASGRNVEQLEELCDVTSFDLTVDQLERLTAALP